MQPSNDVRRLIEIMAALRDPVSGCPWDLEQSFATIAPFTIEEAYEVSDAVERRDAEDLREELGDLLLQVVYHSQLGAEAGLFCFEDVVEAITTKMIRRHPHVFGDETARNARSAKGQWERIKAEEKAERALRRQARSAAGSAASAWASTDPAEDRPRLLDGVPASFPALTLALKLQEKAAKVGFDWTHAGPIREKLAEELGEFDDAIGRDNADAAEDELGDLLFTVVNLSRFHRIDPEKALRRSAVKFRRRFGHIEDRLTTDGKTLDEAGLDEMEALWIEAKADEVDQDRYPAETFVRRP